MPKELPLPAPQKQMLSWPLKANALLSVSFGRPLDKDRWKAAWEFLLQRHPVLRSSFSQSGQSLFEHDQLAPSWVDVNWSEISAAELGEKWNELQKKELEHDFTLGSYPLWRTHILQLPNGNHHFLWTVHPALFDEKSAGELLVEWFTLYSQGSDADPIPSPTLSSAIGSMEVSEDTSAAEHALEGLTETVSDPFAFLIAPTEAANASKEWHSHTLDLDPACSERWESLKDELTTTSADLLSVLWGGFLARLNVEGESLTATSIDLHSLLAPEHLGVLGRLEVRVPLRLLAPNSQDPLEWLRTSLETLRLSNGSVFVDWQKTAASVAKKMGFPPTRPLPLSEVLWLNANITNHLHTALPRWLGADARWNEAFLFPVTLRGCAGCAGRGLRLEIHHRLDVLDVAAGYWLLDEFASFVSTFLQTNTFQLCKNETTEEEPTVAFSLNGDPDLFSLINRSLHIHAQEYLLQAGADQIRGGDVFAYSNQIARFLRRGKAQTDNKFLICMNRGPWLSLVLLALVRDRSSFLLLAPEALPEDITAFCNTHEIKFILLDSSTNELFASVEIRKLVVDSEWDKISEVSNAEFSPRKLTTAPVWSFCKSKDTSIQILGEDVFTTALPVSVEASQIAPHDRLLSTAPMGTPALLEETLISVLAGATLVHPQSDIHATRSAFQTELEDGAISHLRLPASRWADWVHFLVELQRELPPTLRVLHIQAGRIGHRIHKAWHQLTKENCQTFIAYSPFDLLGLGWHGPLAFTEISTASPAGFPLGQPIGQGKALCLNGTTQPLPIGFCGQLAYDLPNAAIIDGLLPLRKEIGFSGYAGRDGTWFALQPPDWITSCTATPYRRVIYQAETALTQHPKILDAVVEILPETGKIRAWIILLDSNDKIPSDLSSFFRSHGPSGWELQKVASLLKYPVDESGLILTSLLPDPQDLATAPAIKAESRPADSTPATTKSPSNSFAAPILTALTLRETDIPAVIFYGKELDAKIPQLFQSHAKGEFTTALLKISFLDSDSLAAARALLADENKNGKTYLVAQGNDAWTAVRITAVMPPAPDSPLALLLINPAMPNAQPATGFKHWKQTLLNKISGKSSPSNTRRESALTTRPIPCDLPAQVLIDAPLSESLNLLLPEGEFFDADLATSDTLVTALLDVLRDSAEATETPSSES